MTVESPHAGSLSTESGSGSGPALEPAPALARLVAEAARRYPNRDALAGHVGRISYAELDGLARRWATALGEWGVPRGGRVGIVGNRSRVTYIGALAAAYAGAAFVPINTNLHEDRTERIARLADLDALIVEPEAAAWAVRVAPTLHSLKVVLAPESHGETPATVPWLSSDGIPDRSGEPCLDPAPDWGCYLLFTSGTTGTPKGVQITQGNVAAYLRAAHDRFDFRADDRFSQMFEQSFDVSIFDLFVAWSSGACVCTLEAKQLLAPASYLEQEGITVFSAVPSVLALLMQRRALRPGRYPHIRYSMFAGEALTVPSVRAWAAAAPNSVIENQYGPTETTVVVTACRWSPDDPATEVQGYVPIGKPFAGVDARVVDAAGNDVAPGEPGELWIGGLQTFAGYWKNEEQTRERLVPHAPAECGVIGGMASATDGTTTRYYRTGDLVKELATGDLVFLSRVDHQLKVMGRRIEPGEIEAIARQVPGVSDAVALGWPIEERRVTALTMFILASDITVDISERVRKVIAARVEPFLVPREVRVCEEFPRNANGKVNRAELLAILQQTSVPVS